MLIHCIIITLAFQIIHAIQPDLWDSTRQASKEQSLAG